MASFFTPTRPFAANSLRWPSPSALTHDPIINKVLACPVPKGLNEKIKDEITKEPNSVFFIHINAQSLLSHFDYFKDAFSSNNIHIIAVSETWLQPCINSAMIELPGYDIIRIDRIHKGGGGVAI